MLPWLETLFLGNAKHMLEVAFCYPSQDIQICILLPICSLQLSNVHLMFDLRVACMFLHLSSSAMVPLPSRLLYGLMPGSRHAQLHT